MQSKLDSPFSRSFIEVPLNEAITDLAQTADFAYVLELAELSEQGISADTPITINLRGVPLRSFLRHMLEPHGLIAVVADDVLVITSEESAHRYATVRVFALPEQLNSDIDDVISVIRSAIRPAAWRDRGGHASIIAVNDMLAVSATEDVHADIAQLLHQLRWALETTPKDKPQTRSQFSRQLTEPVSFTFIEVPLQDAIRQIAERKVRLLVHKQSLAAAGVSTDQPITIELKNITLHNFLTLMLKQAGLTYVVRDDALVVTTETAALKRLTAKTYVLPSQLQGEAEQIAAAIEQMVRPELWNSNGGPGTASTVQDVLVVATIEPVHHQVLQFLERLTAAEQRRPAK